MIRNPRALRSELHFRILGLLAGHVAVPILAAELHELARKMQSPSAALSDRRSPFYVYLHRLADAGWIKIGRLENRLAVLLTKEGERQLEWFTRHGGRAGLSLVPNVAEAQDVAPGVARRAFERIGGRVRETRAFLSYDIPVEAEPLRATLCRILCSAGFERLHESMWVGDPRRLPAVVGYAERLELLPKIQWGAIQVFRGHFGRGIPPRVPGQPGVESSAAGDGPGLGRRGSPHGRVAARRA
ncbi:MAG: hypothetical protein HYY93_04090 [Planctomycetes bacterium]|nr:hypothetical protein [Planctomycetota bacterium]